MTEAAVGNTQASSKKPGKLRTLLARRRKPGEDASAKPLPAGYRTFSRKLAPGLVAAGGVAAGAGALGTWIRSSRVVTEGLAEEEVGVVMGHEADWGRLIAVVAALAVVSSIGWLTRNLWLKLASALVSVAVIVLVSLRLPIIDEHAAGLADQARTGEVDFVSFHAGFGWGAWLMVVGAVMLFLGISAGILRELDVRRGVDG